MINVYEYGYYVTMIQKAFFPSVCGNQSMCKCHVCNLCYCKTFQRIDACTYLCFQTQSFGDIYDSMAKHEFVAEEQVSMFFRDQKVQRYDTPARLGLTVADILGITTI